MEQGTDRAAAVRCAEAALQDQACTELEPCLWRGLTVLLWAGELVAADAALRRLERGSRGGIADVLAVLRAQQGRLVGDLAGAQRQFGDLAAAAESSFVRELALPFLAETFVAADEVEAADALLAGLDWERYLGGNDAARPLLLATRGAVHLAAGRFSDAFEDLSRCARLPKSEASAHVAVPRCRGLAALAASGAGRDQVAEEAAKAEHDAALAWGAPAYVGWALYVRAMVEDGEATTSLEDAIDLLDVAHSPIALAAACYELGVRLARNGDHLAAKGRLERAGGLARRMGNRKLTERAEDALGGLVDRDSRTTLTIQERKIAELARTGYSNKQIAERLVLTVRTIEFHLSNVYRKLHISGRRELMDKASVFSSLT
ncbi:helix-turn-helix transcriptional regulator [Amycolatopsis sp. lyj-90]|uniref:helix-turn-helix transcriptional regulator n=1 Tax=Amycolatopsis sp. lyj-90 TaxID=2789285 RepID=UPI00397BDC47